MRESLDITSNKNTVIHVGSRKSQLALNQTEYVVALLSKLNPNLKFNIHGMTTTGDDVQDKSLSKIGSKSLFTKELESALYDNRVDLVVHSLKDMPTTLPDGMILGALLKRVDPRDSVVISKNSLANSLEELPDGSVIGTSSVRRIAQLKRHYPLLQFKDIVRDNFMIYLFFIHF